VGEVLLISLLGLISGALGVIAGSNIKIISLQWLRLQGMILMVLCGLAMAANFLTDGGPSSPFHQRGLAVMIALTMAAVIGLGVATIAGRTQFARGVAATGAALGFASSCWLGLATGAIPSTGLWPLAASLMAMGSSAFLLGAATLSMLMGHSYLVASGMSIAPMRRVTKFFAWGLAVRAILAGSVGLAFFFSSRSSPEPIFYSWTLQYGLFAATRILVGLAVPAVLAWMAWKTVQIRSTQSATGILFAAMIFVYMGELTFAHLMKASGLPL
jgi:hypothetical protein